MSTPTLAAPAPQVALHPTLPLPPTRYVVTQATKLIRTAVLHGLRTGDATLVDGDFGVGKTLAVVETARTVTGIDVVYVNMFGVTSARDALAIVYRALTGEVIGKSVTGAQLRDDLIDYLKERPVLLIIDDAHRLNRPALETLLSLWNRVHNDTLKGVPMVFVGNNLLRHLGGTVPELVSRAGMAVTVDRLTAKNIESVVLQLEPGLTGTRSNILVSLNTTFRGQMRQWKKFFEVLRTLRTAPTLTGPVTTDEVQMAMLLLAKTVSATPTKDAGEGQ